MRKTKLFIVVGMWVTLLLMVLMVTGCSQPKRSSSKKDKAAKASPTASADKGSATTSVNISSTTSAEPTVTDVPTTIATQRAIPAVYKRKTARDPFVAPFDGPSPTGETTVAHNPKPTETKQTTVKVTQTKATGTKTGPKTPVVTDIPPDTTGLSLTGVMKVGGGYQGIIVHQGGKSYMVTSGDTVGEWKVSSVSAKAAVLRAPDGRKTTLKLNSDLTAPPSKGGKSGGSKPGSDEGPKAPSAPAPPRAH